MCTVIYKSKQKSVAFTPTVTQINTKKTFRISVLVVDMILKATLTLTKKERRMKEKVKGHEGKKARKTDEYLI